MSRSRIEVTAPARSKTARNKAARNKSALSLRARALRWLARREHSRLELQRKLSAQDASAEDVAALLDELERRGWLSETRLAEQHIARAEGRYGARRVLHDLRDKGVANPVLQQAAGELKRSELASARTVWRKRFGKPPADPRERARQARFLEGRGFSTEVVRRVVGGDWQND
jgi:regulatory protein